jgi:hypothetical protein
MFNRRDLLKSASALAIPAPGLLANAASTPSRARPDADGTIRLRFPVGYATIEGEKHRYFIVVEITTLDAWRALDRPIDGELTDENWPDDEDWSGTLLDDDRVLGVRLEGEPWFEETYGRTIPDPAAAKALRWIRQRFMTMLEDDPEIGFFSIDVHGNGECSVTMSSPADSSADPLKVSFAMAD